MKTLQNSIMAILLVITFSTPNLHANETPGNKKYKIQNFKKLIVKGNVMVTIVSDEEASINYENGNLGSAQVLQAGSDLYITGQTKEVSYIILHANNLYRIEASENAQIKSQGKLSTHYLQLYLRDNAHAELEVCNNGMITQIEGNAIIQLSGKTASHNISATGSPKMDFKNLDASNTTT